MAYIYGKPQTKRVFGTGDFSDQWIEIRRAKMTDVEVLSAGGKRNVDIVAMLITDWSITDENGDKVSISGDTLNELPVEISMPAIAYFNEVFLTLSAFADKKPANSKN